jgi:hypothetical protein
MEYGKNEYKYVLNSINKKKNTIKRSTERGRMKHEVGIVLITHMVAEQEEDKIKYNII